MKKIYSLFIAAAAATSIPAMAQQLPNAGFENGETPCIPWTSNNNTKQQGTNPDGWISGNTIGTGSMGKTTVISFVAGHDSETAVKATNVEINVIIAKKTIPGYFALGTAWSTSEGTGSKMDGGTFGGIDFSYRPDALSFYYQSATDTDKPTVLAYTWKGHWTQANVPANIVLSGHPTSIDMTDRDRNILGIETSQGGDVTHTDDAALVSVINQRLDATTTSWTYSELNFEYKDNANPEQINVVFGAGDYFNVSPIKNNSVTIDDIRLLYFSRLKNLSINGQPISNFDSKTYTYDLSDTEMPDASAITYELLSNSGSSVATINLNEQEATATITVTNNNNGGTDYDNLASHTYTIQFKKKTDTKPEEWGGIVYDGTVTIDGSNAGLGDQTMDIPGQVHIIDNENGTCTFVLPNFSLGEGYELGDIVVENVTKTAENPSATTDGAKYTYNGSVRHLKLNNELLGEIIANVTIEGTTENGIATMQIHVNWLLDPENDPDGLTNVAPIEVLFNGKNNELAGIGGIEVDNNADAPVEYFNLKGMRISSENLAPGIYIRRQGTDVKKILVK